MSSLASPGAASYAAANEPGPDYRLGSPPQRQLQDEPHRQSADLREIPLGIGGRRLQTSERASVVSPHAIRRKLASVSQGGATEAMTATGAAQAAHRDWSQWSPADRAAVFLRAADLLAGPRRQRLNAATMLGQSKTAHQAEIDSACELIDFLRFNVQFAAGIAERQPLPVNGVRNITDYRPLEGFVYAVTPFNFTAIAGNLPMGSALLGSTVTWKPAAMAVPSNYLFMEPLGAAGLPSDVINFLPGNATEISGAVLADAGLAGIHFTGSTAVFDRLWREVANNLSDYRSYPSMADAR